MRRAAPAPSSAPSRLLALAFGVLITLLLAACVTAEGTAPAACDADWESRRAVIVEPDGEDERAVEIECMRSIEPRRVRIGFTMPAGPECHRLSRIDLVETADAVSITIFVARSDDATAGACAPEPQRARTELDLQAAVGDRELLDGSRPRPSPSPASPGS